MRFLDREERIEEEITRSFDGPFPRGRRAIGRHEREERLPMNVGEIERLDPL